MIVNTSAPDPQPSPDVLVFHSQPLGTTSAAQTVTVTNAGAWTFKATPGLTGSNASEFAVTSDSCSDVLVHVTETCSLQVVFSPTETGDREAILSLSSNTPGDPRQIHLIGTTPAGSTAPTPGGGAASTPAGGAASTPAGGTASTPADTAAPSCTVTGVKTRYKPKILVRKGITATVRRGAVRGDGRRAGVAGAGGCHANPCRVRLPTRKRRLTRG